MTELVFDNALLVTPTETFRGSLCVRDGRIHAIDASASSLASAIDCAGDYLLPGLVELHTDGFEKHLLPRPGVRWPMRAAAVAHDAQLLAAGITTALDAIAVGDYGNPVAPGEAVAALKQARDAGLLRIEHHLHLRCELPNPDLLGELRPLLDDPQLRLLSLMDHTPGQRQFHDLGQYRRYYGRHGLQWSDADFARFVEQRREVQRRHAPMHASAVARLAVERGVALASHDDGDGEHVREASAHGVRIAEFPVTLEAAQAATQAGLVVLAGAPNLVRGGSHSGNVAASELAQHDALHAISSDYVPASLLHGVFLLERLGWPLHRAVAAASAVPARAVGFDDRGAIVPNLRADLLRVRRVQGEPVLVGAWLAGRPIW